jgi:hypothetical protein
MFIITTAQKHTLICGWPWNFFKLTRGPKSQTCWEMLPCTHVQVFLCVVWTCIMLTCIMDSPLSHSLYRNKINPYYSFSCYAIFQCSASQILKPKIHYLSQIPVNATPHPTKLHILSWWEIFIHPLFFPFKMKNMVPLPNFSLSDLFSGTN